MDATKAVRMEQMTDEVWIDELFTNLGFDQSSQRLSQNSMVCSMFGV